MFQLPLSSDFLVEVSGMKYYIFRYRFQKAMQSKCFTRKDKPVCFLFYGRKYVMFEEHTCMRHSISKDLW